MIPIPFIALYIAANGTWQNCTITTNSTALNNFFNTINSCSIASGGGFNWVWTFIYLVIYLGVVILFMAGSSSGFIKYTYAALIGMLLAFVMAGFGLLNGTQILPPATVEASIAVFGIMLIASVFIK